MGESPASLADTLAAARTRARAVDHGAFERRFGTRFEAEATERWNEFDFVSDGRRVDEVLAWAVAEVQAEVAAIERAERVRLKRKAANEAAHRAQVEQREREAWARTWLKKDPRFRIAAANHETEAVYHWTPIGCLESIMGAGIRPRAYLDRHDIPYERHSYGTLQKAVDFSDHIAVSLRPQRGMFWHVEEAVLLVLDRRVLARNGAFYVPGNSASRLHDFAALRRRTSVEDFEALFADPHAREPADWQAEIWIPQGISPRRIEKVIVRDLAARAAAIRAIARYPGERSRPSIDIESDLNEWTTVSLEDLPF